MESGSATTDVSRPSIVVTYSVLGSLVSELVGDAAHVITVVPDGKDPHDFEPSAKDIEALNEADLIVSNGLDFEEGLVDALTSAEERGVAHFVVTDHVTLRTTDGHAHGSDDRHADSDETIDPHVWLSPFSMSEMIDDLASTISQQLDLNLDASLESTVDALTTLDESVSTRITQLDSCILITGHDELGYLADRYGCTVVGAVIPSFSTTAEASAGQLADLESLVRQYDVRAIFTGLGTSSDVVDRLSEELGVPAVELSTHYLSGAPTYAAFMTRLVDQLVDALS